MGDAVFGVPPAGRKAVYLHSSHRRVPLEPRAQAPTPDLVETGHEEKDENASNLHNLSQASLPRFSAMQFDQSVVDVLELTVLRA